MRRAVAAIRKPTCIETSITDWLSEIGYYERNKNDNEDENKMNARSRDTRAKLR